MSYHELYRQIGEKRLRYAILAGLLFLLLCLAINYNYFGLRDFDHSKLIHFGENLAKGQEGTKSLLDWLAGEKKGFIGEVVEYLMPNVEWGKSLIVIIGYIALCLLIFERLRKRLAKYYGEERPPLSWKFDTGILEKLQEGKLNEVLSDTLNDKLTSYWDAAQKKTIDSINTWLNTPSDKEFDEDQLKAIPKLIDSTWVQNQLEQSSLVFLVDHISTNDLFAQFWETLANQAGQHLGTKVYRFESDPRICFDNAHEEGLSLSELSDQHADSILVVIGDGKELIDPSSVQLNSRSKDFERWSSRFLLTPQNPKNWSVYHSMCHSIPH